MRRYLIQKTDEENRQTAVADVIQRDEPVFIRRLQNTHNTHFFKNKIPVHARAPVTHAHHFPSSF